MAKIKGVTHGYTSTRIVSAKKTNKQIVNPLCISVQSIITL